MVNFMLCDFHLKKNVLGAQVGKEQGKGLSWGRASGETEAQEARRKPIL